MSLILQNLRVKAHAIAKGAIRPNPSVRDRRPRAGAAPDPKRTVEVLGQTAGIRTARVLEVGDVDPAEIECHRRC